MDLPNEWISDWDQYCDEETILELKGHFHFSIMQCKQMRSLLFFQLSINYSAIILQDKDRDVVSGLDRRKIMISMAVMPVSASNGQIDYSECMQRTKFVHCSIYR